MVILVWGMNIRRTLATVLDFLLREVFHYKVQIEIEGLVQ